MAQKNLHDFNGRFCESDFENAFISFLEDAGWTYLFGEIVERKNPREVLISADLHNFLHGQNPDLNEEEIQQLCDNVRLAGAETDFAALHKVYGWMVNGIQFTPQNGLAKTVNLIDFTDTARNIFRVVNQFSVDYVNNDETALLLSCKPSLMRWRLKPESQKTMKTYS